MFKNLVNTPFNQIYIYIVTLMHCLDGRMVGWQDGRMVGWQDGRMVGWQDGRMVGCPDARTDHSVTIFLWLFYEVDQKRQTSYYAYFDVLCIEMGTLIIISILSASCN